MTRTIAFGFWLTLALVLAFITLPLVVVVAASLSPTAAVSFRPWDWTPIWYGGLFDERWVQPFLLSVRIAVLVAAIPSPTVTPRTFGDTAGVKAS